MDLNTVVRPVVEGEERKRYSAYVVNHACVWVGLAAGAIFYLLKNGIIQFVISYPEDNAQLFIDFSIESLLDRMVWLCVGNEM